MPKVTHTPLPAGLADTIARRVEQRVVLATARVETAVKHKIERQGPPRSKPGEPPARDSSRLIQSIHSTVQREGNRIVGRVVEPVGYAAALEYGTAKMAPRPHARPTLAEERDNVAAIIGAPGLTE